MTIYVRNKYIQEVTMVCFVDITGELTTLLKLYILITLKHKLRYANIMTYTENLTHIYAKAYFQVEERKEFQSFC